MPSPVDPLVGWNTTSTLPHVLQAGHVAVPAIPSPAGYAFNSPNTGAEARAERNTAVRLAPRVPIDQPELAFVYGSAQAALATLDRVATVATYNGTVTYPANNGFAQALKAVAGAMVRSIGTRIFYVTTGGFDNHSGQNVNAANGTYYNLMATLNDGLFAFYTDLTNQGLLDRHAGRSPSRSSADASPRTAATAPITAPRRSMLAMGGNVKGGLYGTAPSLNPDPANPTLENNGADVTFQTDFRSVYARVIDQWLGADSRSILGGDFRAPSLTFV